MTMNTQVFAGARDRLLPASVPFSFFGAACLFHVLAWAALLRGAGLVPGYGGGLGTVLAAIHLTTLGVLAMTAMGAAYQLLPVATREPLWSVWPARLSFWLAVPGVLLLTWGMDGARVWALSLGGALVSAALGLFALLIADNLRRAKGLPVVVAHGWAALAALGGVVVLGLALIGNYAGGYLKDPVSIAFAHATLGVFGFMSMLAFGFSHILIPMFALSRAPPARLAWMQYALSVLAVIVAVSAIAIGSALWLVIAALVGLGAVGAYFLVMRIAMRMRMRKRLGLSFLLVRTSWGLLGFAMALGLAEAAGFSAPNGQMLFWFLALGGWLLTFLTAVLQRIMPFLATMHATGQGGRPPLVSELSSAVPLQVHAVLHLTAIALVATGIALDVERLVQIGAAAGLAGAFALCLFALKVFSGLRRTTRPAEARS